MLKFQNHTKFIDKKLGIKFYKIAKDRLKFKKLFLITISKDAK
ncbi:hypothetical protein [Campylobacter sputorum]|nr:hypothetical protein [Campylobacter sputorum]